MVSYSSICIYWKWPNSYHTLQLILVLSSCFLVHLSIGTLYTYGNLVPYLVSYVREYSSPKHLRFTDTPYVYACQVAGQGSSMILGGILERRFGPRLITLIGGILMSSGVALSYFSIQYSFWLMLFTYGIMFGFGIGLAYVGPLACAMRWLPKWKGIASGIVVSGFGLSALIFNTVQTGYINPENVSPDRPDPFDDNIKYFSQPEVLERVPHVFLILACCYICMQLIGCIFIVNPYPSGNADSDLTHNSNNVDKTNNFDISKQATKLADTNNKLLVVSTSLKGSINRTPIQIPSVVKSDDNSDTNNSDNDSLLSHYHNLSLSNSISTELESSISKINANYIYNFTPFQMLRKVNFYFLWVMFFLSGTSITFISSLYKSFGLEEVSDNDHLLSIVGGVSAIFNLLGRIVWGGIADLTTYKFALVLQSALMTCLLFTLYSTTATGEAAFFVWICGIFFCIGGYFSLFPAAIAKCFGQDNIGVNYGILFTSQILGGLLAALISQILVDHIYWYGMLFFIGGLSCLEFVLTIFYKHKRYVQLLSPNVLLKTATRVEESTIKFPDNESINKIT